jgi:transketolase
MEMGRPNLAVFAETMLEIARNDSDLTIVTGDSRGSARLKKFCATLPEKVVEVGIAEQNRIGIAAGLSMAGTKVFAVSPASFLTARALEQIKNDVAYSDNPVKLIGISAGVSYGALGSTHHSLHDVAALRAVNNIHMVVPADNFEARKAIEFSVDYPYPLYIRFGKKPLPHLHDANTNFEIGKAIVIHTGSDVTFIATGETVFRAVEARNLLEEQGFSCGVISMHTLKPLDEAAIFEAARSSRVIITIEEHSVHGGLGSACASLLLQEGFHNPFKIIGIPDEYTVTGSQAEIFEYYGITPEGLAQSARELILVKV